MSKYICVNFGDCESARSGKTIEIEGEISPRCPDCGGPLQEVPPDINSGGKLKWIIIAIVVLLVILGIGWYFMSKPKKTEPKPEPVPVPAVQKAEKTQPVIPIEDQRVRDMVDESIALMKNGKWNDARNKLLAARGINAQDDAVVYYNLASLDLRQKKVADARKNLATSIEKGFKYWDVLNEDEAMRSLFSSIKQYSSSIHKTVTQTTTTTVTRQ